MRSFFTTILSLTCIFGISAQIIVQDLVTIPEGCYPTAINFAPCNGTNGATMVNGRTQYCYNPGIGATKLIRWSGAAWEIVELGVIVVFTNTANSATPPCSSLSPWVEAAGQPCEGVPINVTGPSCATALPIELVNFTARTEVAAVKLTWATASERNNKGFMIERNSNNLGTWEEIGYIAGAGNSTLTKRYEFTDRKALKGNNYYRLRQIDLDGRTDYSPVVSVQLGQSTVKISPNPVDDLLLITLSDDEEATSSIRIFDAMGRVVAQQSFAGRQAQLNMSYMPVGTYLIEVGTNGKISHERVVVR